MNRGTGRTRLMGMRVVIARLLAVAFLFASLLVPPFAEAVPSGAPLTIATVSAAADQDSDPVMSPRPHGLAHAGSHCACQLADRLTPPEPIAPTTVGIVVHPATRAHARASLEAEPPARPPRA